MSFLDDLLKRTAAGASSHIKTPGAFGQDDQAGSKIAKACGKHRCDHSNPGGVVSDFFREKRTRL